MLILPNRGQLKTVLEDLVSQDRTAKVFFFPLLAALGTLITVTSAKATTGRVRTIRSDRVMRMASTSVRAIISIHKITAAKGILFVLCVRTYSSLLLERICNPLQLNIRIFNPNELLPVGADLQSAPIEYKDLQSE